MLFSTPLLDPDEERAVERILELKERLSYAVGSSPRRWQGLLRRSALARAVRGSNSIEGYTVAVDDAIAVVDGQQPLDANEKTALAVRGYQTAMTYVLQLANDPHFQYSEALIRSLHFMMIQHDLTKNPGLWRPGPIYVRDDEKQEVVYEGPSADLVPALIDDLVNSLNDDSATAVALVRAAMAHLNFVMIHPFSDGNGRMARCLQTLVLARTGTLAPQFLSIEEYLGDNTGAYYDILARIGGGAWHPERDAKPWLRFCLTAHFQQATKLLRRAREIDKLWDALEQEILKLGLPERVIYALADAAMGWRIRNATYRPNAEVSDQLAGRDLRLAVRAGLLVATGERRGRFYVSADRLKQIRMQTREPRPAYDDPFVAAPSPVIQYGFTGLAGA
jgi:Fic family protein